MGKLTFKCTEENRKKVGCGMIDAEFSECEYCTKNGYCGYWEVSAHNEILNVFDRLGQLEDAAEQREQGCDFCNKKCATCYWYSEFDSTCDSDYDPGIDFYCNEEDGEYKGYIHDYQKKYCPRCGRKLV